MSIDSPPTAEPAPTSDVIILSPTEGTGQVLRDQFAALLDQAARAEEVSE